MMFKIIWFVSFGMFAALMVLIGRPFPEALGIFMAYLLGGLATVGIMLPSMKKNFLIEDETDES
jgi:hypothetical protein